MTPDQVLKAGELLGDRKKLSTLLDYFVSEPRVGEISFYFEGYSSLNVIKLRDQFGVNVKDDLSDDICDAVLQWVKTQLEQNKKELTELGVGNPDVQ